MGQKRGPEAAREALRAWLAEKKKTGAWLADQIGATQPTVSRWLNTAARPEEAHRAAIELVTDGAIPAVTWRTEEEEELLARLEDGGAGG